MIGRFSGSPLYYGWFIVFISAMAVFFSGPGQTYSNAAFIDQYIADFEWSRSYVSALYSTATICSGFLMMLVGRWIDKFGQRAMMIAAGSMLSAACFFNSFISSTWMMAVGFFLIRFFGQGSMTLIPNTLVPQWFVTKRGRAMSFMAIGGIASSALLPIINTWMIERWDWQLAWRVWGFLLLFIFVPLAFFVRNRPADIGLVPDGNYAANHLAKAKHAHKEETSWTLKEAFRTKAFLLLLFCAGIPALIHTGITFHIVSLFGQSGISPSYAATALSLMAIVGFPITFLSGFLLEKIKANVMLAFIFGGHIVILTLLLLTYSIPTAIVFGVVWGIVGGIERITLGIIWSNYFGTKHIGSINGVVVSVMVVGSALGPLPFGLSFDWFHSYTPILLILMLLPLFGIAASLLAKKPEKINDNKNLSVI